MRYCMFIIGLLFFVFPACGPEPEDGGDVNINNYYASGSGVVTGNTENDTETHEHSETTDASQTYAYDSQTTGDIDVTTQKSLRQWRGFRLRLYRFFEPEDPCICGVNENLPCYIPPTFKERLLPLEKE